MGGGRELKDSKEHIVFLDGSIIPLQGCGRQEKHLRISGSVPEQVLALCWLKSTLACEAPTWLERP